MKKLLSAVALVSFLMMGLVANSQSRREMKAIQKEAKVLAKELKKEGFKPLELGVLESHIERFLTKKYSGETTKIEIVGNAEECETMNTAQTVAYTNAANIYAADRSAYIKGRVTSEVANIPGQKVDNMLAAFEKLVGQKLSGELQRQLTVVKENRKGVTIRTYYLIDFEVARNLQKEALTQALEEQELYQEYGSKISSWIGEGFENLK